MVLLISVSGDDHITPDYGIDDPNPFINRDYNKCIMCTRCVRACDEITGAQAIFVEGREHMAKISTFFDRSLLESTCVFCGQCIMVCPVGALTSKVAAGKGKPAQNQKVVTICSYCGVGCTLELNVRNNKIVGVISLRDKKL